MDTQIDGARGNFVPSVYDLVLSSAGFACGVSTLMGDIVYFKIHIADTLGNVI